MSMESWNPIHRRHSFKRHLSQSIGGSIAQSPDSETDDEIAFRPAVDLIETPTEFQFFLSIPGLVEDDIVIEINGRYLTIRGEREAPYDHDYRTAKVQEWQYGYFERRFKLASEISSENVRGGYETGVLTIVVEKIGSDSAIDQNDPKNLSFDLPDGWLPCSPKE